MNGRQFFEGWGGFLSFALLLLIGGGVALGWLLILVVN